MPILLTCTVHTGSSYCNTYAVAIREPPRHANLRRFDVDVGCTMALKIGRGTSGESMEKFAETDPFLQRPIIFRRPCSPHAFASLSPLRRIPKTNVSKASHTHTSNKSPDDLLPELPRRRASSRRPACFDCQGPARNRPRLHLLPSQSFNSGRINNACHYLPDLAYFWTIGLISSTTAPDRLGCVRGPRTLRKMPSLQAASKGS